MDLNTIYIFNTLILLDLEFYVNKTRSRKYFKEIKQFNKLSIKIKIIKYFFTHQIYKFETLLYKQDESIK